MVAPNDITLSGKCPVCGVVIPYARSLAPDGSIAIVNRVMACPACGSSFVLNTGIAQGVPAPIETETIPPGEGDSGGAGALFLD